MSQYPLPPSFDGQHNYAPQWPVQFPHLTDPLNQNDPKIYAINNNPINIGGFTALPFGATTSTQIPGIGIPTNVIQSPYTSQQFSGSNQVPVPPYGGVNTPFSFPTDSSHPTPQNAFAQSSEKGGPLPTKFPRNRLLLSDNETDREEGEISEGSVHDSSHQQFRTRSKTSAYLPSHLEGPTSSLSTNTRSPQPQLLTVSPAHDNAFNESSRSTIQAGEQSSYNPSVSSGINSVQQAKLQKSDIAQVQEDQNMRQSDKTMHTGKSPAQMRVMAQGALLKLAPHKIRFSELVKENINPSVLKQLYDEIGIKVTSTTTKLPERGIPVSDDAIKEKTAELISDVINVTPKPQEELLKEAPSVTVPVTKANETSDKPLERKDVIARMLAEKAKKKAVNPVVNPTDIPTPKPDTIKDTQASLPSSKDLLSMQPKEKNKAQTELARQRIEQLKKMGLKRQQSNFENTNSPPVSSSSSSSSVQITASNAKTGTTNTLPHPLPDRPPVANSPPKPSTPQIPGLSLSSENVKIDGPSTFEQRIMNNSTPFKNSLGKRPRASDFDGPIPETKKPPMSEERVVIDISEDEASDVDEDIVMSDISDIIMNSQSSKTNGSMQRTTFPRNALSASATPQSRPSELESLRQKDLEIQAMRRKIAEMEEKNAKKVKSLLSSASVVDAVSPPLAVINTQNEQTSEMISEKADSVSVPLQKTSSSQSLQRSSSMQSSASMDSSDLNRLRQKLLRKRDIETGLPVLDAELLKFEAKLAEFKREEEKLLSEIAKSREERTKLTNELESLGVETENLTVEELKAVKEDIQKATAQAVQQPADVISLEPTLFDDLQNVALLSEVAQPSDQNLHLEQKSPLPEVISLETHETSDIGKLEDTPYSGSSGSSMDESTSISESSSMDQESEAEQHVVVPPVSGTDTSVMQDVPSNVDLPAEFSTPSVLVSKVPDSAVIDASTNELNTSRESSVQSDNYEPPEPEESSDADEAYSPKLSPSNIEDSEIETVPKTSIQNDADMTLTRKPQDFVVIASKGDALDNPPDGGNVSKFTPYQSPLKYFRSYRYHPGFVEDVKDSYRSLTYSHKIDPSQALCPYEAAGGVCNDATCEFQHWRDMVMSDDKILIEMGNQKEGKTPEEQAAYIEGLEDLLNNMRRDQVNDISTVASEIAAYRRRFLSDPSRILPL